MGLQEGHQSVLDFLVGGEHRLLVGLHQFLELGVLEPNVVQDPSVVQEIPLEGRADVSVEGRRANRSGKNWAEYPSVPLIETAG